MLKKIADVTYTQFDIKVLTQVIDLNRWNYP